MGCPDDRESWEEAAKHPFGDRSRNDWDEQ